MSNGNYVSIDDVNMPYSLEAEQAVLGSVLIDPSCITQVLILVKPEYFYLPQHRAIFTIMQELDALGNKIDPLIVLEKLKNENGADGYVLRAQNQLLIILPDEPEQIEDIMQGPINGYIKINDNARV